MKTNESGLAILDQIRNEVIAGNPDPRQCWKAMKSIQWRLRGQHGEFVGLEGLRCAFVDESNALTFDGRDNEAMKLRFYEIWLGPLTIEVLSCAS